MNIQASRRVVPWFILLFVPLLLVSLVDPSYPGEKPGSLPDLNGTWLMKDFPPGAGITQKVNLPGRTPKDALPIEIPGTVRTALLASGRIPDPYYGYDNEKSLWVEQKEWWFFRTFTLDASLRGKWIDLVFEGASFQGEAWVNGKRVGTLKGMLNPRSFDVKAALRYGGVNSIAVRLEATPDAGSNLTARGLTWDSPRDQLYSVAQCVYGWDWGPHGVPVGLWRPVRLRVSGPVRVDNPHVTSHFTTIAEAVCTVEADVRNLSDRPQEGRLEGDIREEETDRGAGHFSEAFRLGAGESRHVQYTVTVNEPRLWWPNGMGKQNMYRLSERVWAGGAVSESTATSFGIRELKLVENENVGEFLKTMKVEAGNPYQLGKVVGSYPWTFLVNGRKMFAKGGNWIPVDQLLRLDRARYDRLLLLAKDAHFNLLRVWGGGLYETDDFYELCDRYGILAWQEFLSNRSFSKIDRQNFLEGAESAVYRLRNHPSLTFWCGGNEFDPDDTGSKTVIDSLAALLARLDPAREFHRASPYKGDDHYWGVWHGQEPYTKYRVVRPFRSEAGVNTFPVAEDYARFTPPNLLWPLDTTYVEYHGEYNTRFELVKKLNRYADEFGAPVSIADEITKSELYQALATSFNMEFCRSHKFQNSGVLIWQYNDIWPCISWSIVDWYGTPKPSYYYLKRAAEPLHIAADYDRYLWKTGETFAAEIHLLNDTEDPVSDCAYEAKLLSVRGKTLAEKSGTATTASNTSATVGRIEMKIPEEMGGKAFFVSARLKGYQGTTVSGAIYPIAVAQSGSGGTYSGIFDEMGSMPPVPLRVTPAPPEATPGGPAPGSFDLTLANPTENLAFFVRVRLLEESESLRAEYSDNYFSLLPGETTTVHVTIRSTLSGGLPGRLRFEISGWNVPPQTCEVDLKKE
ncbi:MAG TPA: glycoside hydrolase family 2 protein [Bacteroidota bacterium]|nr:glycoside hydrolase family 2 protein [Bacteroidota bacterium]